MITSANLTMDGAVGLEQERKDFLVSYKGDASLGSVRMLDKLTNDLFFRMAALNVNRIDFALGKGPPKVHVGADRAERFLFADHSQQQRQAESEGHHGEPAGSADVADARGGRAGIEGRGSSRRRPRRRRRPQRRA